MASPIPHNRALWRALFVTTSLALAVTASAQNLSGWKLTFDDEFNGTKLDTTKWNTCFQDQGAGTSTPCSLVGNNEMELYQPSSQFTEANGILSIRGDKLDIVDPVTGATYHYASGVLASYGKFSQTHGYFEMRAQLPAGQGLWPAFWMIDNAHQWPPELDPLEMLGNQPDAPHLGAISSSTGAYYAKYIYTFDTSTAYHTYGLEWDASNLTYYYDGKEVGQTTTASNMGDPMQLIANLAIGGNWPGPPNATTVFPAYMKIDYIRAWSRNDSTATIPYTAGFDVGNTGLAGSTAITNTGTATISGAGSGYFGYSSDSFQYAAQPTSGDTDFTLQVNSVPSPNGVYTPQTGIMVRENLNSNARYTAVFLANNKCILQSRTSVGGIPTRIATLTGITYPSWIRLIRKGDAFTAYISSDGISWNLVGNTTNDISSSVMTSSAYVGAAVSSGNPSAYNTLTSTNFNIPAIQVTQDNADSSGVTITGSWVTSTNNGGYYGINYMTDGNQNKGQDSVSFTPNLPSSATYDVYMRWIGNETGRATNVPVSISAADGTHNVTVNQQHQGSMWVLLGTYPFSAGASGSVSISNAGTNNTVSVDAVQFVPGVATAPQGPSLPAAPTNLSSIGTPGKNQVTLSWSGNSLATSYSVLRATTSGGPYQTIATLVPTSVLRYTDSTATPGAEYFYVVDAVNASGSSPHSNEVKALPSFIVDDADASGVTITGTWNSSTSAYSLYYASDYLTDGDTGSTGGKSVQFMPTLSEPGKYYVFVRWSSGANRASNVPVDVNSEDGKSTFTINQTVSDGVWWYCLGSFAFNTDGSGNVTVRNDGADGYVIADAVEFVRNYGSLSGCPSQLSQLRHRPEGSLYPHGNSHEPAEEEIGKALPMLTPDRRNHN